MTDEGTDFRLCLLYAGGFRRLRAATYIAHGGKVGKTPPGTRPMDYGSASLRLGPSDRFPRTPLRGTRTYWILQHFRRAKFEWRSKFPLGHWALVFPKLQLVRFYNCAWLCRTGGGWCWAVGRGLLDAPRISAGRPVSGPYEKNTTAS